MKRIYVVVKPSGYASMAFERDGNLVSASIWLERQIGTHPLVETADLLFRCENVPSPIRERILDQGTSAQWYDDGYDAWQVIREYATGNVKLY